MYTSFRFPDVVELANSALHKSLIYNYKKRILNENRSVIVDLLRNNQENNHTNMKISQFFLYIRPFFLFPCFTNMVLLKLGEEGGEKIKIVFLS